MSNRLTDEQWAQFERDGYLKLGRLLDAGELSALQGRIDDIMLGKADVDYDRMLMQLDVATDDYSKIAEQTNGFKESTLNYRKIQDLEWDPIFLEYMQRPLFRDLCERAYGAETRIGCLRAMFVNKPAGMGSVLPFHQDRWSYLDRDPRLTVWTALDPATIENGCVQIIAGSHRKLLNPEHPAGFLTDEMSQEVTHDAEIVYLQLEPGEGVVLHNWLLHGSDVNRSDQSRRAFSVCYADADTCTSAGEPAGFSVIFGNGALDTSTLRTAGR